MTWSHGSLASLNAGALCAVQAFDDAGLPVELDAVDEDPGEPFFDELPADEWAA